VDNPTSVCAHVDAANVVPKATTPEAPTVVYFPNKSPRPTIGFTEAPLSVVTATDESVLMMDVEEEEEEDAPVKAPAVQRQCRELVVAFQSVAHTSINIIITAHTFHHYATFFGVCSFFSLCLFADKPGTNNGRYLTSAALHSYDTPS
jgi:hypothetical protein